MPTDWAGAPLFSSLSGELEHHCARGPALATPTGRMDQETDLWIHQMTVDQSSPEK